MSTASLHRPFPPRLKSLAACLAAALGLTDLGATPVHPAGAIVVTSCADSGSGSLRAAVQAAGDGDAIDLSQLPCSLITLTSGRIDTSVNLLISGPGSGLLTIDGNDYDRIFNQNNPAAELAIYGVTLTAGYGFLAGGCVYSQGVVALNDAVVTGCRIIATAGTSIYKGGGIYTKSDLIAISSHIDSNEIYTSLGGAVGAGVDVVGNLFMVNSTISGNLAQSAATASIVNAGGANVGGTLTMQYSTIADNTIDGVDLATGVGGGVRCVGVATIQNSTISGNSAGVVGGLMVYGDYSLISDSTISGNSAKGTGGIYAKGPITIANSTIAFNTETNYSNGAGLRQSYGLANLQSTIVANNTGPGTTINIGQGIGGGVTGNNNLIGASGATSLPPDTIQSDPMLLPLANNGGTTKTHALRPGSPAIDHGNNVQNLTNDQRGPPFARVIGTAADIGAVEFDLDIIFADGFD